MKESFKALYSLFFFKPYTTMSRKVEIACGVVAWLNLLVIIYGILK